MVMILLLEDDKKILDNLTCPGDEGGAIGFSDKDCPS